MAAGAQMIETAFKNETVGLVTRAEFLSKRDTLRDRMDEASAAAKRAAEHTAEQVWGTKPAPSSSCCP
jgi:protein FAM50